VNVVEKKANPSSDHNHAYLTLSNGYSSTAEVEMNAINRDGIDAMLQTNWRGITKKLADAKQLSRAQELLKEYAVGGEVVADTMKNIYPPLGDATRLVDIIGSYGHPTEEQEKNVKASFHASI
jgi:hypothetical protein